MPNQNWGQRVRFKHNCQRCGKKRGSFVEYCMRCGAKLPPVLLSEAEIEEEIQNTALILDLFGGCGQLFHSFLQEIPEVIFCPRCGKNLRPTIIN